MFRNVENASAAIEYIETHLTEKMDLEIVAQAVHYSKYHLHRVFAQTAGISIHGYIQRRKLTEAAKRLVFSQTPIIDIAFMAGYESQQAFSTAFKTMYKKSPHRYRKEGDFYPLQWRYVLHRKPARMGTGIDCLEDIVFASREDIPLWMDLVHLVVDGFPYLKEDGYRETLETCIEERQALIMKDAGVAVGVLLFGYASGCIDFLGIHPQYGKEAIARAFLQRITREVPPDTPISITTFREGDKADPGYRKTIQSLGFSEAGLLTEFGYPTQRFILKNTYVDN
jgi:AraC-like DNA-binding protein